MAQASPAVRAAAQQDALEQLDKFEPGARARVLERLPPDTRQIMLTTSRSAWVSIEHDHYAVDVIVRLFGPSRAVQYWRGVTNSLIERPILKSFVSGMVSIFGDDPGRIIGILPKGWSLVYRDLCEPVCLREGEGKTVLRFENLVPEVRIYSNYFHSWHGTCLGVADLARIKGKVTFDVAPDQSAATATFFWT
ncbi:MAG: hypothetical protein QM778_01970 [Myxococcales bacterium]